MPQAILINWDYTFDRYIVESLIDKIVISEDKNTKKKKVDMYYKFQV